MRKGILGVAIMLIVVACGSGDTGGGADQTADPAAPARTADPAAPAQSDAGGGAASGGSVVNPQPPGQGVMSVAGLEYTFTEPGGVACAISDGEFSFSFRQGDNEVTIGGGGFYTGGYGWGGGITLIVANPEGEPGPVHYTIPLPDIDESALAFDGSSMSYSGPVVKRVPGGAQEGEDAGSGTVSVTCP